jgi:hypothetical protein
VGARSADIGVSIQNVGNEQLTGTAAPASNENFADDLVNSTCTGVNGISLAPAATCALSIYAQPTTAGAVNGTVTVSDNSLNGNPATQTIALQATGQATETSYTLTVTPVGSGSGTVTDNLSAINCSGSNGSVTGACSSSFANGSLVTLTAAASGTSAFLGWGGACASYGTAPACSVVMNAPLNVTASFDQQSFGNINVCASGQSTPAPCSATLSVTFNIAATTNIGAIQVVTQGATGLDFSLGSGSTCTGTITGGNSCNVNVNFNPLAPGLRMGAVTLYDSTGNLVATEPIYGIGQGPLAAFSPGTQLPVNTGLFSLGHPAGILTDTAGNLFISDVAKQEVLKVAPGGSVTSVGSGFQFPQGMAEDGAGDLFIADNNLNRIVEIPAGCASGACQKLVPNPLNLRSQLGVAVDGAGNLFIGDFLDGEVAEVPANGGPQTIVYNPVGSDPVDLTTDAAGDLFVADFGLRTVAEVPAGCTVASCIKTIGSGWSQPDGVAVDAAGDVFVADEGLKEIVEVPAGCTSSGCLIVLVSGVDTVAVKVDPTGNLFFDNLTTPQILEITRSLPPSLSFALTNVGSTSADSPQTVSVQNIGNGTVPLAGSLVVSTLGPNFGANGTCGSFSLPPGKACSENFSFAPQATGYFTAPATFSDNTLNLSSSVVVQQVNLTGIGGLNGQAVTTAVPNVVGFTQAAAASAISAAGLTPANGYTAASSIVPAGSVIASNPLAGTQVNLGSQVKLLVSSGPGQPPSPNHQHSCQLCSGQPRRAQWR